MHDGICPECRSLLVRSGNVQACLHCGWEQRRMGRLWLTHRDIRPTGFDAEAAIRLRAMEPHFWMRGRRRLVERLLDRLVDASRDARQAVELGCGAGGLLLVLEQRFSSVIAVDAYAALLEQAALNSKRTELLQADVTRTPLLDGEAGLVMALDVIEHVDPDALLTEARRIVAPGGVLLLSVPAAPALWSRMDELAGHRCRYTRSQLADELARNGWTLLGFTHYQCLLFPLVWLSNMLGKRADPDFERRPPAWLDHFLGGINDLEIALFGAFSLPFGSSLFMWAEAKPKASE